METFLICSSSEKSTYVKVRVYFVQVIAFILKNIKILFKYVMLYSFYIAITAQRHRK